MGASSGKVCRTPGSSWVTSWSPVCKDAVHGPNETFQRRWPGEQHLPRAQLGLRGLIQVLRCQAVLHLGREPRHQALPRGDIAWLDVYGHPNPLLLLDIGGFPVGRREEEGGRQLERPSQRVEDADGDRHVIGDKAPEEAQGTPLEGKATTMVVPATP